LKKWIISRAAAPDAPLKLQGPREIVKERAGSFLAEHNLYVCQAELKRIKQAIRNGRLWEHTEMRVHGHPALLSALKRLRGHDDFLEMYSPTVKGNGFFYFDSIGLVRPEITHYRKRLAERYEPPRNAKILFLLPTNKE